MATVSDDGPELDEFVLQHGPDLVRLARGLLKDPQRAEDVVQDVLAKALLQWPRIRSVDNPYAYVRRMVVNACTSHFRRLWVRREASTEPASMPESAQLGDADQTSERDAMLALLRQLPPKQRAVLVLRHYEGLEDTEIATVLGCSTNTVRSNAFRGLATLRTLAGAHATEGRA